MTKEDLIEVVSRWTKTELYQRLANGHTIWSPSALVGWGFSEEWVAKITRKHESGKEWKEQLYDKTGAVDFIIGVYGGLFVDRLADEIGADTTKAYTYFGRGKTAQALAQSIENVVRGTDQAADEVLKKNSGRYLDEIRRQEAGWTR
jgi:hypothetical protein